jgi:hypothetical protein
VSFFGSCIARRRFRVSEGLPGCATLRSVGDAAEGIGRVGTGDWEGTDDAREDAATLVVSATGPPICAGGSAEHTALYSAHVKICDSRSRSAVSAPLFI